MKKQTHKQTTNKNFQPLPVQLNQNCPLGMVVGACNPSTRKAEEAGLGGVQGQPGVHSHSLSQNYQNLHGFQNLPQEVRKQNIDKAETPRTKMGGPWSLPSWNRRKGPGSPEKGVVAAELKPSWCWEKWGRGEGDEEEQRCAATHALARFRTNQLFSDICTGEAASWKFPDRARHYS